MRTHNKKSCRFNIPQLIPSKIITDNNAFVLEHPFIPFISLISEWPPEAIKNASLCIIELLLNLEKNGLTIRDGHSLNVQFLGPKPIFIDIGSITDINNTNWWIEFEYSFIKTLQPLITKPELSNFTNITTLQDLYNIIKQVQIKKDNDLGWSNYPQPLELNRPKDKILWPLIEQLPGKTFIDIGCNAGLYSKLVARTGKKVVAIDIESNACDRLYLNALNENLDILVLNYDIKNEYGNGRFSDYYMNYMTLIKPATKRLICDSGIAIAIQHHLVHYKWTLDEVACKLSSYVNKALIVEFIPKEDVHVAGWDMGNNYTLDSFLASLSKYWKSIKVVNSDPNPRLFVICWDKYL